MPIKRTVLATSRRKSPISSAVPETELALLPDAKAHSGSQNVADASGVVAMPRRSEMPKRGQLCGDCSQATAQARLG
jgi:hypothetical protein